MPTTSDGVGVGLGEALSVADAVGEEDPATVVGDPPLEQAVSARTPAPRAAIAAMRWCRGACTSSSSGPPP
jgi:hypothetical protein